MADPTDDDGTKLQGMISGYMMSQILSVTAILGIADLLGAGEASVAALAKSTETHHRSLARLLRALAAWGILEETQPGCFKLTAFGAPLRTDVPGSLRNLALARCGEPVWRSWSELLHTVHTGETAFEHVFGMNSFQYTSLRLDRVAIFDDYMAALTRRSIAAILASHDFSRYRHIVDVGGGSGALLSRVLAAVPGAEGCIFDTPAGVEGARRRLEQAGVSDRCRIMTGDFFEAVPEAADAYILKSVLHDWDDDQATIILENCRRAMHPDSVLLIVERLLPERITCCDAHREITMMDMHMMVVPGGRERTIAEYAELCAAARLQPSGTRPTGSPFAITQARKIDAPTTSHTAQAEEQRR
jgi:orsellinic acid C2-O-methyltransferase